MGTVKVAINGFGRIGRLVFRQIYNMKGIDIVAINDLTSPQVLAHLLKYDSAQGRFNEDVKSTENSIIVNGEEIKIYTHKNPAEIPWKSHDVDVVLECTGFFADKEKAEGHIKAGAKRVVISAPATGDPAESRMVPKMLPFSYCANALRAGNIIKMAIAKPTQLKRRLCALRNCDLCSAVVCAAL